MKRTITYLLAAISFIAVSCDGNIPKPGMHNMIPAEGIVLDEMIASGYTMRLGKTLELPQYVSALPEKATDIAQAYGSDDDTVAEVDAYGTVTAVGLGTCSIFITVGRDEALVASFELTVEPVPSIKIKSIEFNQTEKEYTFDGIIKNIANSNLMTVISADPTEEYTEKIIFTSSNTDVVDFDTEGNMILKPAIGDAVITATAAEQPDVKDRMTIRIPRIEYERFPGDGTGAQREIMSDYEAIPHTDGGWAVTELVYVDRTKTSSWVPGGARNGYRYAMFDGRRIISREPSAPKNDLPTATNGTAFCWDRPGGRKQSTENDDVYFIIDMQRENRINYFRTVNISEHADDRAIRLTGVSEIFGSNDGENWTSLGKDIRGFNPRSTQTHTAETIYPLESLKAHFTSGNYRYVKFLMERKDFCYGYFNKPIEELGPNDNDDKNGGTMQVAELYLGYDPALEETQEN